MNDKYQIRDEYWSGDLMHGEAIDRLVKLGYTEFDADRFLTVGE